MFFYFILPYMSDFTVSKNFLVVQKDSRHLPYTSVIMFLKNYAFLRDFIMQSGKERNQHPSP